MEATEEHSDLNATQSDIMTAGTADACHDQQPFPFMRLPPELRLMVYQCALHDITDPIMFPESCEALEPHPCRGALALLCTSKFVRKESSRTMLKHAYGYFLAVHVAYFAANKRHHEMLMSAEYGSLAYEQAKVNSDQAYRQFISFPVITTALATAIYVD